MANLLLLNLGCGSTTHPRWVNIDQIPGPHVRLHDLRHGIPYSDSVADVCYSSHVIEHMSPDGARAFVGEQHRVLKPGGIIRAVVPDLEVICRNYCAILESLPGDGLEFRYDYTMLELYDQTVRSRSGGEMRRRLEAGLSPSERAWVVARHGQEALSILEPRARMPQADDRSLLTKLRRKAARLVIRFLVGREAEQAYIEGLFRRGGEIHQWMYDRFSLSRLLVQQGFVAPRVCRADESEIPDFGSYGLEVVDGVTRKPDSLFIEARK
jgi:predicted SAM-dependent methyltransferase